MGGLSIGCTRQKKVKWVLSSLVKDQSKLCQLCQDIVKLVLFFQKFYENRAFIHFFSLSVVAV